MGSLDERRGSNGFDGADYASVVELFLSRKTRDLHDVQIQQVQRAIRESKDGIYIYDLPLVEHLIVLLYEEIVSNKQNIFISPLSELLEHCGKPFIRNSCHAEFKCEDQIVSILLTIATLLKGDQNDIKVAAANALWKYSQAPNAKIVQALDGSRIQNSNRNDQRPSPWVFAQRTIQKSGAVSLIVEALKHEAKNLFDHDSNNDGIIDANEYAQAQKWFPGEPNPPAPVFMVALMKVVQEVSAYRDNALILIREGALIDMVRVSSSLEDFGKEEVKLMLATLWNVLEHSLDRLTSGKIATNRMQLLDKYRYANAFEVLGNRSTIQMMCNLFKHTLKDGYRNCDKEIRNEVLIVSSLLARRKENRKFFKETGFLSLLLEYGTATENNLKTECDYHRFSTGHVYDFEMKQLIWYLICDLSKDDTEIIEIVSDSLFARTLLFYIDEANTEHCSMSMWSMQKIIMLRKSALNILCTLSNKMSHTLREEDAISKSISFIFSLQQKVDTASVSLDGNLEEDYMQLIQATLQLCLKLFFQFKPDIMVPLKASKQEESNIIFILLKFIDRFNQLPETPDCFQSSYQGPVQTSLYLSGLDAKSCAFPSGVRELAALVLSQLCKDNPVQQNQLIDADGPRILREALLLEPSNFSCTNEFIISVIGAVWNGVVGNPKSELEFIAGDGVSALLFLLEECPADVRLQCLGCLSDLLQNRGSIPYFFAWKSEKTGISAPELVLNIWIEEEQTRNHLGLPSINSEDLIIAPLERPLRSSKAQSISEVSELKQTSRKFIPTSQIRKGNIARLKSALQAARSMLSNEEKNDTEDEDGKIPLTKRKVYSLLRSVGFRDIEEVTRDRLTADQRIVLCVASHFYEFLEGEIFANIRDELLSENITPIQSDEFHVSLKVAHCVELAEKVQGKQIKIISETKSKLRETEENFYRNILLAKEQAQTQRMETKRQTTSAMKRRQEQKERIEKMLAKSHTPDFDISDSSPETTPEPTPVADETSQADAGFT